MDQSAEIGTDDMAVIRGQMDETRSALAQKLGRLERQVSDTVQGAAQSVGDTVENVKHAVEDTVNTVKTSVRDTMHSVGEAVSISHHVEQHPWAMVAGATALGFVGGYMLMHKSPDQQADERFRHLAASQGRVPQPEYDSRAYEPPMSQPQRSTAPSAFNEWLKPAATQVQGLAVGAALGFFRDMLTQAVPKPMAAQVKEMMDGLTTSLGGQVVRGSMLEQFGTPQKNGQQS